MNGKMQVAKPTALDLEQVWALHRMLYQLCDGYMPFDWDDADGERAREAGEPEFFDQDDAEDCRRVMRKLLGLPGPDGALLRVAGGMEGVILYEPNAIVDPDAEFLVIHPSLREAWLAEQARRAGGEAGAAGETGAAGAGTESCGDESCSIRGRFGEVAWEVFGEIERAMRKFPTWPTDPLHAFAVVGEEYGELNKELLQLTYEPHKSGLAEARKEAVQLAAMALRFLMSFERYEFKPGAQHSQNDQGDSPPIGG